MALVAITFSARSVFGLFLGNENFTFAQFVTEPLFDVPADGHFDVISSIASIDGSQIFVGKMDGTLTVAKIPVLQGVASEPYGLTTLNTLATKSIDQTSVHSNDSVYLVSLIDSEMGTMQVQNVDGAQFSNIDLVPQPLRFFMSPPQQANLRFGMDLPRSWPQVPNWQNISKGLPANSNPSSIHYVLEPAGASYLYLFTDGWSLWRKALSPAAPSASRRNVRVTGTIEIFNNGDSNGMQTFPFSYGSVSRDSAVALLKAYQTNNTVVVEMEVLFTLREDDVVEARIGVWLINTNSGHQDQEDGGMYLLERGTTWSQSVYCSNDKNDSARLTSRMSNRGCD
ncbi:hypothetical protein LTR41_011375 [Exophiala xenobiotica]|nr:hypothetical protein LTR41_011375 [Exophiala xenobiotica]KAK5550778.1 hypothetical protein LTR46_011219 [Exophiala xenobiotica]